MPDDRDVPDEVPTADYLDQQTTADPNDDVPDDDVAGAPMEAGRVEVRELGAHVEADEADLIEQSTSVPPEDDQLDETE